MNDQRIFLLGATGYVGQRIAAQLVASGFQVDALVRNPNQARQLLPPTVNTIVGNLLQPEEWIHHIDRTRAVINAAFPSHGNGWVAAVAEERKLIEQLAEQLKGCATKLILSNGTAFLGDSKADRLDETSEAVDNHPAGARAAILAHALAASDHQLEVIELRLASFVYGYGGSVFVPILQQAAAQTCQSIYVGDGEVYTSTVHVDAAARAYVAALHHGQTGVYHIAGDEEPTVRDIAQAVAISVGSGCEAVSVRAEDAGRHVDPFTALFLSQNNRLDSQKARRELGWSGHTSVSLLWDVAYGSYATTTPPASR